MTGLPLLRSIQQFRLPPLQLTQYVDTNTSAILISTYITKHIQCRHIHVGRNVPLKHTFYTHTLTPSPLHSHHSPINPLYTIQSCTMKTHASEIRVNQLINYDNKLMNVISISKREMGRGHTTYTLELRDESGSGSGGSKKGKKQYIKFNANDDVERVTFMDEELIYLYHDNQSIYLMHPSTYEQLEVSIDVVGNDKVHYLQENSSISVKKYGDQIMSLKLPDKAICTIQHTSPPVSTADTSQWKPATLTNGMQIEVPHYIEIGEKIWLKCSNHEFIERVKE